jgi:threonine synthase
MKFYSTKNANEAYSLRDAVLMGLPDDKGLFLPEEIPSLPDSFYHSLKGRTLAEISVDVATSFLKDDVPAEAILGIVSDAIHFDAPLVTIEKNTAVLELFHGPTLAFKDFGARFMARLIAWLVRNSNRKTTILVATSGDTGSAVANGFYGVEGIEVVILYPSRMVSPLQEKQLTTLGRNITALEIDGTFDDCQRMVKEAFVDPELKSRRSLTSANSINISRLIPQSFYYFYAYAQSPAGKPVVFSVPSGNFGNLTAGILAKRMGLPVQKFVASTNANDSVPAYLQSGNFHPRPSVQTISNAMDVGNPSNFERLLQLHDRSVDHMRKEIAGYSFSDEETREQMKAVYANSGYILDPHGAVGLLGMEKYAGENGKECYGIVLETAHPAKFKEVVEETLRITVTLATGPGRGRLAEKKFRSHGKEFSGA